MEKKKIKQICGLTGNRNIIYYNNKQIELLNEKIDFVLSILIENLNIKSFLCRMAVSADLMIAKRIIEYRNRHNVYIKIYSVIPCEHRDLKWSSEQKREYREVLKECEPSDYKYGPYTKGFIQRRNRCIVDNSDYLFAILNPRIKRGGTFQTINYATKQNKSTF